ncbi:hypothetical protein [Jiangella asiatica]|nr:hypothetical protein [Jiangella asiatica]
MPYQVDGEGVRQWSAQRLAAVTQPTLWRRRPAAGRPRRLEEFFTR